MLKICRYSELKERLSLGNIMISWFSFFFLRGIHPPAESYPISYLSSKLPCLSIRCLDYNLMTEVLCFPFTITFNFINVLTTF